MCGDQRQFHSSRHGGTTSRYPGLGRARGHDFVSRSAADVTKAGPMNPQVGPRKGGSESRALNGPTPGPAVNRSAAETDGTCEACELIYRAMDLDSSCEIPNVHDPTHAIINVALARLHADLERVTKERDDRTRGVTTLTNERRDLRQFLYRIRHYLAFVETGPVASWVMDLDKRFGPPALWTEEARRALAATASKKGGDRT